MPAETQPNRGSPSDVEASTADRPPETIVVTPSTKVPVIKLAGVLVIVVTLVALVFSLGGESDLNGIVSALALTGVIVALMAAFNLFVRVLILRRTTYFIHAGRLEKKFDFVFRRTEREIPLDRIRGVELNQNALQRVFDYGSLVFLTAGPNRSLGFLEFGYIPNPEENRQLIRERIAAAGNE